MRWPLVTLIFFVCFIRNSNKISAAAAEVQVFQEDFSKGFERWRPTWDDGNLWRIVNGKAQVTLTEPWITTEIIPKDSYWSANWKNVIYELEFTPQEGIDRKISFNVQNAENWYELNFLDRALHITRSQNNVIVFHETRNYGMENGKTYKVKVLFHTGLIRVYIGNELIADSFDDTFSGQYGRIGLRVSSGASAPVTMGFDNLRVTHILHDGTALSVPLFKQSDPQWQALEYDSSQNWSSLPTIRRWGCLISSIAMVMHYHGLTQMPDGQPVTPKTLNEWLRSEKDGYVFGGNVNWPAISRLTKKISERYQTAKLEYRRVISPQITDIQKEITSKRPAIGEIPGHFVVVKGITGNEHDYYIHDPLFPYTTLKPHDTNLISLRTLTPSQTDLSYLIIYSHPATEVLLINKDTDQIIPAEQFLEHLSDLSGESTESSPIIKVTQVAKPSFGRYQIVVFQTELAPLQLTIFNYNPEGEFAEFSYAGVYGNQPLFIETSVGSSTPQISSPDMTLPLLKEKLTHLFYQGKISRLASYSKLSQILSWAEAASNDTHKQQRYFSLFVYTLQLLDGTLDPDAYLLLKDQSLALKQLLSPD